MPTQPERFFICTARRLTPFALVLLLFIVPASVAQEAAEAASPPASSGSNGQLGAGTQSYVLMSILKPILVFLVLLGWTWAVSKLDKDAEFFYLKRELVNCALIAIGILAFGVMLLVPIFWVGYPVGVIVLIGSLVGYVFYRNPQVPEDERWDMSLDSFKQKQAAKKQAREQRKSNLVVYDTDGSARPVPAAEDADEMPFHAFDELLSFAIPRNADSIDIMVESESAKFRINIDGVRYAQPAPGPAEVMQLITYLKERAGMNMEERRKFQTGGFKVAYAGEVDRKLELQSAGSSRGMQISVMLKGKLNQDIKVDQLGLLPPQLKIVKDFMQQRGKVMLLTAPEHQGVPTTVYSLLTDHDPYTQQIATLEDLPQREMEGVDHTKVDPTASADDIESRMAVMLRNEPAVFMVSRVFGPKTPGILTEASDATRMYVPLTMPDTLHALQAWMKSVGDPQKVADSMGMILAQRLVRRLCHTCRVGYTPDPAAIQKLGLPADKASKLYRASGKVMVKDEQQPCPDCHGLGYRGRVGVYEIMPIDANGSKFIAQSDLDGLRLYLRKQKRLFLQEAALVKVAEGVTDIKEVTRVMKKSQ